MTVSRSAVTVALVSLFLVACGSVPSTQRDMSALYDPGELELAASKGNVPVVVFDGVKGSPAAASLQQQTIAALRSGTATDADFVPVSQVPTAGYKVVVLLNGPGMTGDALCQTTASPVTQSPVKTTTTHLLAAFCSDQRMLTEVTGLVDGASSADDSRLGSLLHYTALDLFPARGSDILEIDVDE